MRRIYYTSMGLSLFPTVAFAQTDIPAGAPGLWYMHVAVVVCGLFLAAYWAVEAFSRPSVTLGEIPTLPKYMTRSTQYRLGVLTFTILSVLLYALVAYLHREVLPLIKIYNADLYETFRPYVESSSPSYLLIIVLISAAYFLLLKNESDWNVLSILRTVIQRWMAIPSMANSLMTLARDALAVSPDRAAIVLGNPATPYVAADDFVKDRQSLDRVWAELSYMRAWLERQQGKGSDATFFGESNLGWDKLLDRYGELIAQLAPLKKGESQDSQNTFSKVKKLRDQMCRLVACYLVFKNDTEEEIFAQARAFGIQISPPVRDNPLRYAILYLVVLAISIYVGVYGSAVLYDLFSKPLSAALNQDQELIWRWIILATVNTGVPLCAILLAKYLGWHVNPRHDQAYLVSYCWIFLAALCLAPLSLTGAVIGLGIAPPPESLYSFLTMVGERFKWAPAPALTCVYIAYYMDRQTDPSLSNIDQNGCTTLRRVLQSVLFAGLVLVVLLPPTMALQPVSTVSWSLEKLRVVILGTRFLMTMALVLVAQFGLRTPAVPQHDSATLPVRLAA
jgi:hypothetical protein